MNIEFLFPINGEVVNSSYSFLRDGKEFIRVNGKINGEFNGEILINGLRADVDGTMFSCELSVENGFNHLRADFGDNSEEIVFVYDNSREKRFNFFIDDNSFAFTELTRERYESIFDVFYLGKLKEFHDKYNACFTLNTFYRNDHDSAMWTLEQLPDVYREQWEANSDWLKIAFHAYSEFPDAPYAVAFPEKLPEHYKIFTECAERKFGAKTLVAPVIMHFYDIADANSRHFIAEKGMRFYAMRQSYFDELEAKYNRKFTAIYDFEFKQYLIGVVLFCNLLNQDEIIEKLTAVCSEKHTQLINLGSHEQYSFDFYSNYIPDHFERIELTLKLLTQNSFEGVFFSEKVLKF